MFSHPALKLSVWSFVCMVSLAFVGYAYSQSLPPSGGACTKYVSPSGSLAGNTAYTTIQSGVDTLVPGDVLCVGPGTYKEVIRVRNSGTPSQRIVIRAYDPSNKPVIDAAYELPGGGGGGGCSEYWEDPSAMYGPWPKRACSAPMGPAPEPGLSLDGYNSNATLIGLRASHITWDSIDVTRSRGHGMIIGNISGSGWYVEGGSAGGGDWYYDIEVTNSNITQVRGQGVFINYADGVRFTNNRVLESNNEKHYDRSPFITQGIQELAWGNTISTVGKNIVIENNVIGKSFAEGIQVGIFVLPPGHFNTTENLVFRGNVLFDTWSGLVYIGNLDNGIFENNLIFSSGDRTFFWQGQSSNHCVGIASENNVGSRNLIFRNNIVANCSFLFSMHDYGSPDNSRYENYTIVNNTFMNPLTDGGWGAAISFTKSNLNGLTFRNNIITQADQKLVDGFRGGAWNLGNNLWSSAPPPEASGPGDIIGDPLLVNTNYRPAVGGMFDRAMAMLQSGSPAIDAGTVINGVISDFWGGARPTGSTFDIGAHEFGSVPGTVTPPPPVFTGGGFTPTPPPPPPPRFRIGETVMTTSNVNVRSTPSTSGSLITTLAAQEIGTIIGGPTVANGYTWWQVRFDSGTTGWAVENYLQGITIAAPPGGTVTGTNWCSVSGLAATSPGGMCQYIRNDSLRFGISQTPGDISATTDTGSQYATDILGYCGNADTFGTGRIEVILKTSGTPGPGECVIRPNTDYFVNVATNISFLPIRPQQTQEDYAILFTKLPGATAGTPPPSPTYAVQPPAITPTPPPTAPLPPPPPPASGGTIPTNVRIMPLGDSITEGAWGMAPTNFSGYRSPLYDLLVAAGIAPTFVGSQNIGDFPQPQNEGHGGFSIANLQSGIDGWLAANRPDVVLLHAGTNDILGDQDLANAPSRLRALIDRIATQVPGVRIVVAQIVPMSLSSLTNATDLTQVTAFNSQLATVVSQSRASGYNVTLVDMYSVLNPSTDLYDGVHPNSSGYIKMAPVWLAGIRSAYGSTATPPPPPTQSGNARLLFASGFEGSVAIDPPGPCWGDGCWQNLSGTDSQTGFSFPMNIWGGLGRFQLIYGPGNSMTPSEVSAELPNTLITATGPRGTQTRVLRQAMNSKPYSYTQNAFQLQPGTPPREFYTSVYIRPDPSVFSTGLRSSFGSWYASAEWKANGDYRLGGGIRDYGSGPEWYAMTDNAADGGLPYQYFEQKTDASLGVPTSRWYRIEMYTLRSAGSDGRMVMAVDGKVLWDRRGPNYGINNAEINRIFPFTLYTAGAPSSHLVDDLEIWEGGIPATASFN